MSSLNALFGEGTYEDNLNEYVNAQKKKEKTKKVEDTSSPNVFTNEQLFNGLHEEWRKVCMTQLYAFVNKNKSLPRELNYDIEDDGVKEMMLASYYKQAKKSQLPSEKELIKRLDELVVPTTK